MAEYLIYYRALIQYAIIFGIAAYAWLKGAPPERLAASVLPGMIILDLANQLTLAREAAFKTVEIGDLIIDSLALIVFAGLALKANRIYPLWLLAAQLISVMMHFARDISAGMEGIVYFILTRAPSYIQILALAVGLYCHRRRIARYGSYRSWRTF